MNEPTGSTHPDWPGTAASVQTGGVDFRALGHVLGNTCCWGGRSLRFYSVAQHALTVCAAVQELGGLGPDESRQLALHALLADAWRAWLSEAEARDGSAKALEKHARERADVQCTVLEAAGAEPELPESWAQALGLTRRMAEAAVHRDLADAGIERGERNGGPLFPPLKQRVRPLRPDRAAQRWIETLEGLRPAGLRPAAEGKHTTCDGAEGGDRP